jgi:predicted secreted Zn-dependent protease
MRCRVAEVCRGLEVQRLRFRGLAEVQKCRGAAAVVQRITSAELQRFRCSEVQLQRCAEVQVQSRLLRTGAELQRGGDVQMCRCAYVQCIVHR